MPAMTSNPYATKSRTGNKLKPVLKKLTQSERSSLDLMRDDAYDARCASDAAFSRTHRRATSNTSHLSTTTAGSTHRAQFVHPFGQRPYTPPSHSYQGSAVGSEYSSALPEDEEFRHYNNTTTSTSTTTSTRSASNLSSHTPSLSASSQFAPLPILRIQASSSSSRLTHGSNTDLLSPRTIGSLDYSSPIETTTMSPTSALRSSMDLGFRRTKSELDTFDRAEAVRRARREFIERENLKNEKAAREELRAQEKKREKEEKDLRKSMASDRSRTKRTSSNPTMLEKDAFGAQDYGNGHLDEEPTFPAPPQRPKPQRASTSTKKLTQSAWMRFMMWLRTRFLRLEKRASRS